jgi:uncharacterized membrane protein
MARDLSDRHRHWLSGELEHWRSTGIVSPEQCQQILDSYITVAEAGQRKRHFASFALAALAALLVGLAVLLLVAHNWALVIARWGGSPRIAKLAAIFLIVAGSYGGALLLWQRPPRRRSAEVAFFFACLMYGAAIWLIAQVFHVDAHWPDGLWWWALGTVPVALCLDTLAVHCLLVGLLGFWAGAEVIGFPHLAPIWNVLPNGAYTLLPLAGLGLLWCYRKGTSWGVALYVALLAWWIIVQGFSWGDCFWGREEAGIYFIALTAPLMLIVAENHAVGRALARPWRVCGMLLTAGALIPLSFHEFHQWQPYPYGRLPLPLQGFGGVLALMSVLAVATALLVLVRRPTADEIRRGPLARLIDLGRRQWVPLGLGLAAVAMGFTDVIAQGQTAWLSTGIANIAMIALAVWLMHVGVHEEQGLAFAAGVGYFLLWSILRYVDLFAEAGGMLGAAGMFFLCGLALLGLSILWRRRKELRHVP